MSWLLVMLPPNFQTLHIRQVHFAQRNFSKPSSKNGEIGRFNLESDFRPALKISCSVLLNSYPELENI